MAIDCCYAYARVYFMKRLGSDQLPRSPAQERQATSKALWGVKVWAESTSLLPSHIQNTHAHTPRPAYALPTPHLREHDLHAAHLTSSRPCVRADTCPRFPNARTHMHVTARQFT